MDMASIGIQEYPELWSRLLVIPFTDFELFWRMIPVYLNGFLASVYFPPSSSAAVFGGLTALWAGADWIRTYVMGLGRAATASNWAIAVAFCAFGVFCLVVGLRQVRKLYRVSGRRSILTFFAISLYPIQTGHIPLDRKLLVAILVMAVPVIVLLEKFASFTRERVLKVEPHGGD